MSGSASSGSAGVCDEASEGYDKNPRETDKAGSLLQPPIDDGVSAPDGQQTRQSRRYPRDQDDVAQDADRFWRAGCRCHRDQDETKGDSDRSDEVEHTRRDGVLGDPDEAGRRENADNAESGDTNTKHEGKVFHYVLSGHFADRTGREDGGIVSPPANFISFSQMRKLPYGYYSYP